MVEDNIGLPACKEYVVLFSGTKVAKNWGAPTVVDVAQSLARIPRFAGNGWEWMAVALHTFVVADLLPVPLKVYGLTHDAAECVGNDVPRPVKSAETSMMEDDIQNRFWAALGLPTPSQAHHKMIKRADNAALLGEIWTLGPQALRTDYPERNPRAENMVMDYWKRYPVQDCTARGGPVAREFVRRFSLYRFIRQQWEDRLLNRELTRMGAITPRPLKVIS